MPCSLASTRNFFSWGGLFYRLRHDLRYGCHFSDINWGLGHFSKFIFIWFYTLFLWKISWGIQKCYQKCKFLKETPIFWRFLMSSIFLWYWVSCHVEIMCRESWPYCPGEKLWSSCSNQLESLLLILNNSKGKILKKTL